MSLPFFALEEKFEHNRPFAHSAFDFKIIPFRVVISLYFPKKILRLTSPVHVGFENLPKIKNKHTLHEMLFYTEIS